MVLNIVGGISNAVAAICAVVAIFVTVRNVKSDRKAQVKEKSSLILRELYKQDMIDSMLKTVEEKMKYMDGVLNKMPHTKFDEDELEELYKYMSFGCHDSLREAEMIKFYNQNMRMEVKKKIEKIFDEYSRIINHAMEKKYIIRDYERRTRREWMSLKESIYECYFNENFDKLEADL